MYKPVAYTPIILRIRKGGSGHESGIGFILFWVTASLLVLAVGVAFYLWRRFRKVNRRLAY